MTSNSTDTSTSTAAPSVAKVLAALHRLGEATAAAIATEAGLGYSTTTPKLRTLENAGLAEPIRGDNGRSLWRLTDTGRAHLEQDSDPSQPISEPSPTDKAAADTTAQHGPSGDEAQETGGPAGHDHYEQPAATDPTQQPDTAEEPAPPAPADHEAPHDVANSEPENTTEDGSDHSTAEPGMPVAADSTGPAAGAPASDESDANPPTDRPADGGPRSVPPAAEPAGEVVAEASARRASGTLRGAILDILEANPGRQYKVSELCKLVDRANEGTGAKKASAGAVNNAAVKLVGAGQAVLTVEKPATFALADSNT